MLLRTWKIVLFRSLCIVVGAASGTKGSALHQSIQKSEIYAGRMHQVAMSDSAQKELYQWFINGQRVQGLVTHLSSTNEFVLVDTQDMARKGIHARSAGAAKQPVVMGTRGPKRISKFAHEHMVSYKHVFPEITIIVADNRRSRITMRRSLFSVFVTCS